MQTVLDKSRNTRGISNTRHKTPTKPQNNPYNPYNPQSYNQSYLSPDYKNFNTLNPNPPQNQSPSMSQSPYSSFTPVSPNPNQTYNSYQVPYNHPPSPSPTPMKYSGTYDNYQKVPANVRVSDTKVLYRDECKICKATGSSLIRTNDRGAICFTCYSKR